MFLLNFVGFHLLSWPSNNNVGSIWRSLGQFRYHVGDEIEHRCTQRDPGSSQGGFWIVFDGCLVQLQKAFWITVWHVPLFEASQSVSGLQAWSFLKFEWKRCWFLMFQPIQSYCKYYGVHPISLFILFVNFMISGTYFLIILDTFGSLGHIACDFLDCCAGIAISVNF